MNPKTVLCFIAKIWILKREAKESKIRSRRSLNLLSSLFFGTDVENIHLECGNPVKNIYPLSLPILYFYFSIDIALAK